MPYKFYYTIFCGIGKVFHTNCDAIFDVAGYRGEHTGKIRTLFFTNPVLFFSVSRRYNERKKPRPAGMAHHMDRAPAGRQKR